MKHATVNACAILVLAMLSTQGRADTAEGIEFFESRIRPVLVQHCYKCHSDRDGKPAKGGLRVDSREGIRKGGESGHSVVPFETDESLILSAIRYEDYEMPPAGPLDDSIVADFEAWIKMGAPILATRKPAQTPHRRPLTLPPRRSKRVATFGLISQCTV